MPGGFVVRENEQGVFEIFDQFINVLQKVQVYMNGAFRAESAGEFRTYPFRNRWFYEEDYAVVALYSHMGKGSLSSRIKVYYTTY
jgi:hypothetical protein